MVGYFGSVFLFGLMHGGREVDTWSTSWFRAHLWRNEAGEMGRGATKKFQREKTQFGPEVWDVRC